MNMARAGAAHVLLVLHNSFPVWEVAVAGLAEPLAIFTGAGHGRLDPGNRRVCVNVVIW